VKRFNISATPAAILFRDRSMYPLDLSSGGPADADKVAAAVHAFVDGGYEHQVRRGGGGGGRRLPGRPRPPQQHAGRAGQKEEGRLAGAGLNTA
jgi:hypothetical protein